MSGESYHESEGLLSERTKNLHRGIVSLIEELEAIDWYQQRADACSDDALRAVLLHNKNEEVEHAMMTLEWLRRNDPVFEANLRTYLFTTAPITEVEAAEAHGAPSPARVALAGAEAPAARASSLGIASLRAAARKQAAARAAAEEEE